LTLGCAAAPSIAQGASIYDEAISGDLSNSGGAPTVLTAADGSNQLFGTTGRGGSGVDRDYFTLTVPAGSELTSINVLPGTTAGGPVSFIGMEAGKQVTLPTSPSDATGLLGWHHYGPADINTDILDDMSIPADGSSGFTPPLGSGSYSFWVQDFGSGIFNYGFDFALAPVPETGPGLLVVIAVFGFMLRVGKQHEVDHRL
jgi:hypothetical protein